MLSNSDHTSDPLRYPVLVFWSAEDDAYIADVPDLRFCSAHGATPEEAVREVRIATTAWIDAAREAGHPIPPPTAGPTLIQRAS